MRCGARRHTRGAAAGFLDPPTPLRYFARVSAERRIRLVLHYDGSGFHGWQVQRRERTVQGVLEEILQRLTGRRRRVTAAGRTDRGVHATGQVASVRVPAGWTPEALRRAVNALAPPDLWVASADEVPLDFHPRYDAVARTYVYRIGVGPNARSPFRRRWCWPLGAPLDMERVLDASQALLGRHSFAAFAKSGPPERGTVCVVRSVDWRAPDEETLEFEITADRFLHRMVRTIVGTLADIGLGRRPCDDLAALLRPASGMRASPPAPPEGLFLTRVEYPDGAARKRRGRARRTMPRGRTADGETLGGPEEAGAAHTVEPTAHA
jgi:tRNA pseudouridine38-40 synthase